MKVSRSVTRPSALHYLAASPGISPPQHNYENNDPQFSFFSVHLLITTGRSRPRLRKYKEKPEPGLVQEGV